MCGMVKKPTVDELRAVIADILHLKPEEVSVASRFFADLGAESLDLLELSFVAERRYGVSIDRAVKGIVTLPDGNLSPDSADFISSWFPGFQPEKWKATPSKRRLVDVLTTTSLCNLIEVLQGASVDSQGSS